MWVFDGRTLTDLGPYAIPDRAPRSSPIIDGGGTERIISKLVDVKQQRTLISALWGSGGGPAKSGIAFLIVFSIAYSRLEGALLDSNLNQPPTLKRQDKI